MKRVAVFHSEKEPDWRSCKSIVANLAAAYQEASIQSSRLKIRSFKVGPQSKFSRRRQLASELLEFDPHLIALIDEGYYAPWFLKEYSPILSRFSDQVRFLIHCYGDFYHHAKSWVEVEPKLLGKKVTFLPASEKSAKLIGNLLRTPGERSEPYPAESVQVCPFPVSRKEFFWSAAEREAKRMQLGLGRNDLFLIYSGRLSIQKNVADLIRILRRACKEPELSGKKILLGLAGKFDGIGLPHFGSDFPTGFYDHYLFRLIHQNTPALNPEWTFDIKWLGELEQVDLRGLLNAADAFVSFSLHHNEDFGMAVAEALMTGLPLVLTDWGGYSAFRKFTGEDHSCFIPVGRTHRGVPFLEISTELKRFLQKVFGELGQGQKAYAKMRKLRSEEVLKHLSIAGVSQNIQRVLNEDEVPPFSGFSPLLSQLASLPAQSGAFEEGGFRNRIMQELYSPYFSLCSESGTASALSE